MLLCARRCKLEDWVARIKGDFFTAYINLISLVLYLLKHGYSGGFLKLALVFDIAKYVVTTAMRAAVPDAGPGQWVLLRFIYAFTLLSPPRVI